MEKIKQDIHQKYNNTVDIDEDVPETAEELKKRKEEILSGQCGTRKKPIFQYSGQYTEQNLTHKQKRLLKKHLKLGKTSTGEEGKQELRSAKDIVKRRKKNEKKKAQNTIHGRKKARADTKAWLDRRLDRKKALRAAPTKAKRLLVEQVGKRRR